MKRFTLTRMLAMTLAVVSLALCVCGCASKPLVKETTEPKETLWLLPAKINGKWGYVDNNNDMVIEAKFDKAMPFGEDGLAYVVLNGAENFINKEGKFVTDYTVDISNYGVNGMIPVVVDGKYGFVDATGQLVIEPQFDQVRNFSQGLAAVKVGDQWGYIDTTGAWAIKAQFANAIGFAEDGLARCKIYEVWGFIDNTGAWVIQPQFSDVEDFVGDYAVIKINGKKGTIDKSGNWVIQPQYDGIMLFGDGGAIARIGNDAWYAVTPGVGQGANWLNEVSFVSGMITGCNAAVVKNNQGNYGYINSAGEWVIYPNYGNLQFADPEKEWVPAQDKASGKWGYLDATTGGWVIQPQFSTASAFEEDGYAVVSVDEKYGVIDRDANWIIEPQYEDLLS